MPTPPSRASSPRSPRTALAAAADATLGRAADGVPPDEPLGAAAVEVQATAAAAADEGTFDSALNGWGERAAREQLRWQLAACRAALDGAAQLGEAQAALSRELQQGLEQLEQRLQPARDLTELMTLQASLAQWDLDSALRWSNRLLELGTDQWLHLAQEAGNGMVRLNSACWASMLNFMRLPAHAGGNAELMEAEVEHVLSPMAASPLVWPAQEATRQAAQLAASTWNDWLAWTGRFADASRSVMSGTGPQTH